MKKKNYAIGIGLNLFDARAVLLKEGNKVIAEVKKNRTNINANETLKVLLDLFEGITEKAKKYRSGIRGVGLALGGIIDSTKGIVYWPQVPDSYIALPLRKYLENKFGFPVLIENDASACAWAEYTAKFSKYKNYKNVLYMFSGVGCGIILNGNLYRGGNGGAGELFLNSQPVMNSQLGDFSFFRQWPADLGILKRAKELISLGKKTSLIKKISSTGELPLARVFEEAKKKDKVAREAIKEAAFSLGAKISFLINLLNPNVVIIGGGLERGGDFFLEECTNSIKRFAFNEMRKKCKVFLSQLGTDATSCGAAMLVFKSKLKNM